MKINLCITLLMISILTNLYAQTENIVLKTSPGDLEGSILLPVPNVSKTVALIIAGSVPTDRDGNNMGMTNN